MSKLEEPMEQIYFAGKINVRFHSFHCDIKYFTTEPLDDLSYVICSILDTDQRQQFSLNAMGELLGFSMRYGEDLTGHKLYRDNQEIAIFKRLLNQVVDKHLIVIEDEIIRLTKLGQHAIINKCQYHFYYGIINLLEFADIHSKMPTALKMLPLAKECLVYSSVTTTDKYWPKDDEIDSILSYHPNQLSIRLNNLIDNPLNIFTSERRELFDVVNIPMLFGLTKKGETYRLFVRNQEGTSAKATALFNEEINAETRNNLILQCRFLKLWNDKNTVFNYQTLQDFISLVDIEQLSCDSRTDWRDNDIFNLITSDSTPNTWINISRYCDLEVIKENLSFITDRINWRILSERIDEDFLVSNFKNYPWDLEAISKSDIITTDGLKNLILQEKKSGEDWDWDILSEKLDEDFIKTNLRIVNCDLAKYTIDDTSIRYLIKLYPDKRWDWDYISMSFGEEFIIDSICEIYKYLNLELIFDRIFSKSQFRDYALNSEVFVLKISEIKKRGLYLATYSANQKEYDWNAPLIRLFSDLRFVDWASEESYDGFDVNPYVIWNTSLFNVFKDRFSDKGKKFLSETLKYPELVINNPDFGWDWDSLSGNVNIINDKVVLDLFIDTLVWSKVISETSILSYILTLDGIESIIQKDSDAAHALSERIDLSFVKTHALWNWDWSVLTALMYNNIKVENLGHKLFVDKWDWEYLSAHLDEEFIIDNLSKYSRYWDWGTVISRVIPLEKRLDAQYLHPFAICLTNVSGAKCQEGWASWTRIYSFEELKQLVISTKTLKSFWWDMVYFSAHPDFDIKSDLPIYRRFIDWNALSSSESVSSQLEYKESYNITRKAWNEMIDSILTDTDNKWNFDSLTKQSCFISNLHFISKFASKIDWEYICEHSEIFKETDSQKLSVLLHQFENHIVWSVISRRNDVIITRGIYNQFKKHDWDLNALIERNKKIINAKDIQEYPDYQWNYNLLSTSNAIKIDTKLILKFIDKDGWDWDALSSRTDIEWTKELIKAVREKNKPVNWYYIYSRPNVQIDISHIVELDNNSIELNWPNISKNEQCLKLPVELLPKLDWDTISNSKWFDVNNVELLDKFFSFVSWRIVCKRDDFRHEIDLLRKFKDVIKWHTLCQREDFIIDNVILDEFCEYLDWNAVSRSEDIIFSIDLLNKYEGRWNIKELENNRRYSNNLRELGSFGAKSAIDIFLKRFELSVPKIYHFTHLSNAIKIILDGRIQSRNMALGNFDNSAGSNVHRTEKAHQFARFYFTTGTPTQFYNECMGKDIDSPYYERACRNGLPKCPFPVFFVIDLAEVLRKNIDIAFYSDGNMQKDATRYYKVIENPNKIDGVGIYSTRNDENSRAVKQQEFLISQELDIENLESLKIFCFDREQSELLKLAVGNSPLKEKIVFAHGYPYCLQNKRLNIQIDDGYIEISAPDFKDKYQFVIEAAGQLSMNKIAGENIRRVANKAFAHGFVRIPRSEPYTINLVTEYPQPRKWCLYDNTKYIYGK